MSQQICGMTFEQYMKFHGEFLALMLDGGDGDTATIALLKKHGQEPVFDADDEDDDDPPTLNMDYYVGAGLKPWEDVINADPDLMGKKAMLLMQYQGVAQHGDASEGAEEVEIEGVSLDSYAKVCALLHLGESDTAAVYAENGVRDEAHWTAVNTGYQAAMTTDTTGRLVTQYGGLFMKYQPQHAGAVHQHAADSMKEGMDEQDADDAREAEVRETAYKMASGGDPVAIAKYVKEMVPDAEDEDELDYYILPVGERLAEEKNWDALRVILGARFETLQPGGDRAEWVEEEFESIHDDD